MNSYHYTECGLDNVFIENMEPVIDDAGEQAVEIPQVNRLHKVIAYGIVKQDASMSGKELRFLRTEMGCTQAELAKLVHCDEQTVRRWEQGKTPLDSRGEIVIRLLAEELLGLERDKSVRDMAARCVSTAAAHPMHIDGSDPDNYRPVAA